MTRFNQPSGPSEPSEPRRPKRPRRPFAALLLAGVGLAALVALGALGALRAPTSSESIEAAASPPVQAALSSYCVTPTVTCTAIQPGPPGAPCSCKTAYGWVQGVLK